MYATDCDRPEIETLGCNSNTKAMIETSTAREVRLQAGHVQNLKAVVAELSKRLSSVIINRPTKSKDDCGKSGGCGCDLARAIAGNNEQLGVIANGISNLLESLDV